MKYAGLLTFVGLLTAGTAWSFRGTVEPAISAADSTTALVATLSADQKQATVFPFAATERSAWHFIPKDSRKGLAVGLMSDKQIAATKAILQAILSDEGYAKVKTVRELEGIVRDLEGEKRRWSRDPNDYFVSVFGDPSGDARWGLSFEGHHVSLNFTFEDDRIVSSTPQFLGSHPATIMPGQSTDAVEEGFELLGDEAQTAFALAASLNDSQRAIARTSEKAPREIRGAGEAQPPYASPAGVPGRELEPKQRELLAELVAHFTNVAVEPVAYQRLIDVQGLDDVYFSYAGTMETGQPHGFTVQGKTFAIEYVNSQPDAQGNPANHAHAILRDMRGDFGEQE